MDMAEDNPFDDISETKKKLFDEIRCLFEELDALRLPERYVDKKKVKKKAFKTNTKWFVGSYENLFLKPAWNFLKRSINWAEIFYNRLLATKQLIPADKISAYVEMNNFYIKNADSSDNELLRVGAALQQFLSTHKLDIDNSIVGARPPETVVYKFSFYLENHQNAMDHVAETTREGLRRHIITWAKMDDVARMAREVKRMASMLESQHYISVKNITDGDLVLVALPGPTGAKKMKVVYGRVAAGTKDSAKTFESKRVTPGRSKSSGRVDDDGEDFMVSVHVHPDERSVESVSHRLVFPFTEDMTSTLESRKPVKMERLLEDPTKLLSRELNEAIKEKTLIYLERRGVDTEIVDRAQRRDVTIADLPAIYKARQILLSLLEEPDLEFLARIDDLAKGEIEKFILRSRHNDIFIPAREKGMKRLRGFNWSDLPKVRFQRQQLSCKDALEHLQLEKRELLNGTAKESVTDWWLTLIKDECDKFLDRRGYHNDAVPSEYLEVPPAATRPVRDNLQLIQEVLDPNVDKHRVKDMLKGLREKIYPRINRFISNAQIVLAEQFGIDFDSFTLEQAEVRLEEERAKLDHQVGGWIEDMIKDIKYLQEMQELEENPVGEKRLDIVPVTGLIVGRFYRLENELRTVMEVWSEWFEEQDELERVKEAEYISTRDNIKSMATAVMNSEPALRPRGSNELLSRMKEGMGISHSAPLMPSASSSETAHSSPATKREGRGGFGFQSVTKLVSGMRERDRSQSRDQAAPDLDKLSSDGSGTVSPADESPDTSEAKSERSEVAGEADASEAKSEKGEVKGESEEIAEQLTTLSMSSSPPCVSDPSLLESAEGEGDSDASTALPFGELQSSS